MRSDRHNNHGRKSWHQHQRSSVEVNVQSLLLIENRCDGCAGGGRCCCSSYKVCVSDAEVKRIIKFLPEAARFCPHLPALGGYHNLFKEDNYGLFAIETIESGLCVFAYRSGGRIQCSLHTIAAELGLPLEQVKPKVCMLWPMHFYHDNEELTMIKDAFLFDCNVRRAPGARSMSPGFVEVIERVYGEGCGDKVERSAANGERRAFLVTRRN